MGILSISGKNGEKTAVITPHLGNERLAITCCGYTCSEDTRHIIRKCADICVLQYIKSGSGYLIHNGKKQFVQAGDVLINHIGENYEYMRNESDPWSKIWINIRGTLITELLRMYQLDKVTLISGVPQLENVFDSCIGAIMDTKDDIMEETAIAIHRIIFNINKALYADNTGKNDPIAERLHRRIIQEVTSGKTFSEISNEFEISESQLNRRFKKQYRTSPYAYLLDCRLELAKTMLINSSKSISEIARSCGFTDRYYFSTLFRKKNGVSPTEYRTSPFSE